MGIFNVAICSMFISHPVATVVTIGILTIGARNR